jgi:hypothetical protein
MRLLPGVFLLVAAWGCDVLPPLPGTVAWATGQATLKLHLTDISREINGLEAVARQPGVEEVKRPGMSNARSGKLTLHFFDLEEGTADLEVRAERGGETALRCLVPGVPTGKGKERRLSLLDTACREVVEVPDAGTADAATVDGSAADAARPDAGTLDAGLADGSTADAALPDGAVADAGVTDAAVLDAGAHDATVTDAATHADGGPAVDGSSPDGTPGDGGSQGDAGGCGPGHGNPCPEDGGTGEHLELLVEWYGGGPGGVVQRTEVTPSSISLSEGENPGQSNTLRAGDFAGLETQALDPVLTAFLAASTEPCSPGSGTHRLRIVTNTRTLERDVQGCGLPELSALSASLRQLRQQYFP